MKVSFKAAALEFTVTGDKGEVIASHKAENVESTLDLAQLLTNLGTLASMFRNIDHGIKLDGIERGAAQFMAEREAESRCDAAIDAKAAARKSSK